MLSQSSVVVFHLQETSFFQLFITMCAWQPEHFVCVTVARGSTECTGACMQCPHVRTIPLTASSLCPKQRHLTIKMNVCKKANMGQVKSHLDECKCRVHPLLSEMTHMHSTLTPAPDETKFSRITNCTPKTNVCT